VDTSGLNDNHIKWNCSFKIKKSESYASIASGTGRRDVVNDDGDWRKLDPPNSTSTSTLDPLPHRPLAPFPPIIDQPKLDDTKDKKDYEKMDTSDDSTLVSSSSALVSTSSTIIDRYFIFFNW